MKIVRLFVLFGIVLSVFFGCASNATNENEETVVEEVEPISQEILSEENEIAEEITEQVETEPESVQPESRSTSLVTAPLVSPTPYSDAADAYNTGLTYLNSYDNENAEKYFLKAIEIDPNFVDAMDNLGVAYRRQGKLEQAEEIYLKSMSMRGNNDVPYTNLALVYIDQGRYQDALELYIELLDIMPDSAEGNYGLGNLLLQFGYYDNALYYFNAALQIYIEQDSPYLIDAIRSIGLCYYYSEDYENAQKWFGYVLSFIPDDEFALRYLSQMQ